MKRAHIFLPAFLLVLLISSCKKDEDISGLPSDCVNVTGWLVNGHKWVYDHYSPYIFADSLTVEITSVSSNTFTLMSTYDDGFFYPSYSSYLHPCGNDLYSSRSASMTDPFIAYKIDGTVGETWSYTGKTELGYTASVDNEITGKNVSVTVDAGTFSCIKIHTILNSSQPGSETVITDFYINNDYGIIKVDGNTTDYSLRWKNF